MNVTSKISVDLTRPNVGTRVNAVQGDGNTRLVEITLLSGGVPWTPPEGVEAAIAYMQPGGTKGLYNKLADDTAAISISGNVATIILAPQMLTASGTVQASLVFNDAALNRLTTFPFAVSVASNPAAGAQKVEDYLRLQWLEDKLEEYLSAIKASGVFDGKPGDNGVTFTPSVSENGDLSWRNNGGLPNPQTVNILGPQGDSTAATAAANSAQTSAANAETHAADAAASAAAAQEAVGAMGTELSQIKGDLADKLPKSPADWEAWTAEEQAAARERLGIPGDYSLVAAITTAEDTDIITIQDIGSLKSVIICVDTPASNMVSQMNVKLKKANGGLIAIIYCGNALRTQPTGCQMGYFRYNNMFIKFGKTGASKSNVMSAPIVAIDDLDLDGLSRKVINSLDIYANTDGAIIPAGSTINIYGA